MLPLAKNVRGSGFILQYHVVRGGGAECVELANFPRSLGSCCFNHPETHVQRATSRWRWGAHCCPGGLVQDCEAQGFAAVTPNTKGTTAGDSTELPSVMKLGHWSCCTGRQCHLSPVSVPFGSPPALQSLLTCGCCSLGNSPFINSSLRIWGGETQRSQKTQSCI